jgi:hypothetical protein
MPITIAGSGTITGISAGGLPDGVITTDDIAAAAVTQAKRSEQLTLATAQASTSGTSIDFTGIPSWVKKVTVMFNGVSTNGTSPPILRLGTSSGFVSSGYSGSNSVGISSAFGSKSVSTSFFIGYDTANWAATIAASGAIVLTNITGNTWVASGSLGTASNYTYWTQGSIALASALTQLRITTDGGTDTFDAGSINIMYE